MRRRNTRAEQRDAVAALCAHQQGGHIDSGMYWARLDTLCQTLPATTRENRWGILCAGWSQWIGGETPEALLDYYTASMVCFYLQQAPKNLYLLFVQAGSLLAKLEWPKLQASRLNAEMMQEHCMRLLEMYPGYGLMPEKHRMYCARDLGRILKRYTLPNGLCTEPVYGFFMDHSVRYEQALQGLTEKLHRLERSAQQPEQVETPAWKQNSDGELPGAVSGDEVVGLCAFLEKTASASYQRALSRLYSLHRNPDQPFFEKKAKSALEDFFSALRALEIEPVDEERLREEFPEEYAQEMRRRDGQDHVRYSLAACGWSCDGYLITNPTFFREKREESGEV